LRLWWKNRTQNAAAGVTLALQQKGKGEERVMASVTHLHLAMKVLRED